MTVLFGIFTLVVALFVGIYFFLILPRVSNRADTELLMANYAHRGLWDEGIPENSLAAFARAASAGYGIELDVRLSRDRRIMVFHDEDLMRMCGVKGKISDYTYAELRRLRLKGTNQEIPTLDETLALIRGRVPVMIEIKGEGTRPHPALCVRVAHRLDSYSGACGVVSFNPLVLSWFKNYRPSYARGQLVTAKRKLPTAKERIGSAALFHLLANCISRPDFLSVRVEQNKRPSLRLLKKLFHIPVFCWTVCRKEEAIACRKQGCGMIFERIRPPKK